MSFVQLPESVTTCRNLVGGEWLVPRDASLLDVHSPYTGGIIGRVPLTPAAPGWRATPLRERTTLMARFRNLLESNLERLSHLAASEAGKTVAEARAGLLKGLVRVPTLSAALEVENASPSGNAASIFTTNGASSLGFWTDLKKVTRKWTTRTDGSWMS